jgi:hypothetical protein
MASTGFIRDALYEGYRVDRKQINRVDTAVKITSEYSS